MVWHRSGYRRFMFFLLGYGVGFFLSGVRMLEGAIAVTLLYVVTLFYEKKQ